MGEPHPSDSLYDDPGAFLREGQSSRASDAGTGSGNHGDLAVKLAHRRPYLIERIVLGHADSGHGAFGVGGLLEVEAEFR